MTNQQTQAVETIIGTHEAMETKLNGLLAQYNSLEQWSNKAVDLLIELNAILIDFTGHPSERINQILDDYFQTTAVKRNG